jgi:hypothetical protein
MLKKLGMFLVILVSLVSFTVATAGEICRCGCETPVETCDCGFNDRNPII